MKKLFSLLSVLFFSVVLYAQTDVKDVVVYVENDYDPVYIEVGKKDFTPSTERAVESNPLKLIFSTQSIPYTGFTSSTDINDVLPQHQRQLPGYARLGYGFGNDIDAKVAYRFNFKENSALKLYGSLDGYKSNVDGWMGNEWNSRLFASALGAGYVHRFKSLSLAVDAQFSNNVFNYQTTNNVITSLTDKQNSRNYGIGIKGVSLLAGPIAYNFSGSFGYVARDYSSYKADGIGEGRITLGGGISYEVLDTWLHNFGVDIKADAYIYNNTLKSAGKGYDNYVSLDVNPYLNFTVKNFRLRLATKMNFLSGGASFFAVAPNVELATNLGKNVSLLANIGGGRVANSFATLDAMTPYWGFDAAGAHKLAPTYKILDATVGVKMSFEPLSIALSGGYAYTKDDLLQQMPATTIVPLPILFVNFAQSNTHNAHIAARLGYDIRGWMKLSAATRYDFWRAGNSNLLAMKPQITVDLNAEARAFEHLTLRVGYNFTRYAKGETVPRINNRNDLYARLSYQFCSWVGAYVQGNNLLNSKHFDYAAYYARGIRGSLGVTASF